MIPVTCTLAGLDQLPLQETPQGRLRLEFDAPGGLCQLSTVLDAADFDWEELYEILDRFGNDHARTGPWDFSINHNAKPLVPSWWVWLNGRRIGLWFMSRVSLEDLEARQFRGRLAFHASGPTVLELEPYREFTVRWRSALLEVDPDDSLAPLPLQVDANLGRLPGKQWADPAFWEERRAALARCSAAQQSALRRTFDWLLEQNPAQGDGLVTTVALMQAEALLPLIACYRLEGNPLALQLARETLDVTLDQPAWGNPREDGYSHNGDMAAAATLRSLAWAWHALSVQEMGHDRRARVRAKLAQHGRIFFELILLNRDYWGGSVMQDHGWKSLWSFGAAALHMLEILPEARLWCEYVLPRLRRSLAAMPPDGVIPPSNYASPYLYLDELGRCRDTWLALSGEDFYDEAAFHPIVDWLCTLVEERDGAYFQSPTDQGYLLGGQRFYNAMARKHGDGRAALLREMTLRNYVQEFTHPTQRLAYLQGALEAALTTDPDLPVAEALPARPRLVYWPDCGSVDYRDRRGGVTFLVQCGPRDGFHSYRMAPGPCDRLGSAQGAGHFVVAVDRVPLLCTPDTGYSLHSGLCTCLLVNGEGQHGSLGYPMSIPSWRHRGEQVEAVSWDEASGRGVVRLNLAPAYAEESGVTFYTREFLLGEERALTVRDTVVLRAPGTLSWLFQGREELGVAVQGLVGSFGTEPRLTVTPRVVGLDLSASVRQTEIVYSYSSGTRFARCRHVRYDTLAPVESAVVEFVVRW